MPLPMKTLKEVSAELGIPEREIRAMVDMKKIRAVWRKNQLMVAPDELGRIRKMRKTIPESVQPATPAIPKSPTAGAAQPGKSAAKPAASRPPTSRSSNVPKPGLKLPPPPPSK